MGCRVEPHTLLTVFTVIGVVGGTITGLIIKSVQDKPWTPREVMYLQFPGDVFLRMLKALIVPLLTSSIISAVGSLDLSLSKKIAMRSILFYATTTVCAVTLGIILVLTIRPGVGSTASKQAMGKDDYRPVITTDTLMDLIR